MSFIRNFLAFKIYYLEGIIFGYLIFAFSVERNEFYANKYITVWSTFVCIASSIHIVKIYITMIMTYLDWYKSDLLIVFLVIAQDGLFQLQAVAFNISILFHRKRALKWFNSAASISTGFSKDAWKMINKRLAIQIFLRYFMAILVFVLYRLDYDDRFISLYLFIINIISFCTNLFTVEINRTFYFIITKFMENVMKKYAVIDAQEIQKQSLTLMKIHEIQKFIEKYFNIPILLAFGMIFSGSVFNVR